MAMSLRADLAAAHLEAGHQRREHAIRGRAAGRRGPRPSASICPAQRRIRRGREYRRVGDRARKLRNSAAAKRAGIDPASAISASSGASARLDRVKQRFDGFGDVGSPGAGGMLGRLGDLAVSSTRRPGRPGLGAGRAAGPDRYCRRSADDSHRCKPNSAARCAAGPPGRPARSRLWRRPGSAARPPGGRLEERRAGSVVDHDAVALQFGRDAAGQIAVGRDDADGLALRQPARAASAMARASSSSLRAAMTDEALAGHPSLKAASRACRARRCVLGQRQGRADQRGARIVAPRQFLTDWTAAPSRRSSLTSPILRMAMRVSCASSSSARAVRRAHGAIEAGQHQSAARQVGDRLEQTGGRGDRAGGAGGDHRPVAIEQTARPPAGRAVGRAAARHRPCRARPAACGQCSSTTSRKFEHLLPVAGQLPPAPERWRGCRRRYAPR